MQAESLGDLIADNNLLRAKTVLPSDNVIGLTRAEKVAWDLVEIYLLANPEKNKRRAFMATGAIPANYYAARKKAIANHSLALSSHFSDYDRKQMIRPEDRLVRNAKREKIVSEKQSALIEDSAEDLVEAVNTHFSSRIISKVPENERPEIPEQSGDVGIECSDRESLNQILDALEGWDLPVQKRIVETACAFLGLKMFWRE